MRVLHTCLRNVHEVPRMLCCIQKPHCAQLPHGREETQLSGNKQGSERSLQDAPIFLTAAWLSAAAGPPHRLGDGDVDILEVCLVLAGASKEGVGHLTGADLLDLRPHTLGNSCCHAQSLVVAPVGRPARQH